MQWRTKEDLGKMSRGEQSKDFWNAPQEWPNGIPLFKEGVEFSNPPNVGGYNDNWLPKKSNGEPDEPFKNIPTFVQKNSIFDNRTEWMKALNPEWDREDTTAFQELQKHVDSAPRNKEQYNTLLQSDPLAIYNLPQRHTQEGY